LALRRWLAESVRYPLAAAVALSPGEADTAIEHSNEDTFRCARRRVRYLVNRIGASQPARQRI
jgi:hypothetical protein